jgi:hypothetical protein
MRLSSSCGLHRDGTKQSLLHASFTAGSHWCQQGVVLKTLKDSLCLKRDIEAEKQPLCAEHCSPGKFLKCQKYGLPKAHFLLSPVPDSREFFDISTMNISTKNRQHSISILGMSIGTRKSREKRE